MKKPKIVAVVPDLNGEHGYKYLCNNTGIYSKLISECRGIEIVPALNGTGRDLMEISEKLAKEPGFRPIVSLPGLSYALDKAYSKVGRADVVIRLDVDEHPVASILSLAERARQIKGVVVGDLEHSDLLMPPESFEAFSNNTIMPRIFSDATGGKLLISGAHGFCAIHGPVLSKLRSKATQIWRKVVSTNKGPCHIWGYDAMLYLAAIGLGIPIEVVKIPAIEHRNRDRREIMDQKNADVAAIIAAKSVFGW
jgi:hypothetical protein